MTINVIPGISLGSGHVMGMQAKSNTAASRNFLSSRYVVALSSFTTLVIFKKKLTN